MPGRYNTHSDVSWHEAVNEDGAIQSVLTSAGIVLLVTAILLIVGLKVLPHFKTVILSRKGSMKAFFICCGVILLAGLIAGSPIVAVPAAILIFFGIMASLFQLPQTDETGSYSLQTTVSDTRNHLVYDGSELDFSDADMEKVLVKYLPYYSTLDGLQKALFIKRTRKFMQRKNFVIHDTSGFKEMPILISGSAIQLSFGLEKYLLPVFGEIHIYPDEFVSYHQSFRIVIGNVSNNCINISWKHFLNGFSFPDGVNVGLHEMAHAYHYQNFAALDDMDDTFVNGYKAFEERSKTALLYELSHLSDLYTLYGLSNEQEFWAESVELFFEKPEALKTLDSGLFTIISTTLHQNL